MFCGRKNSRQISLSCNSFVTNTGKSQCKDRSDPFITKDTKACFAKFGYTK